jgi:hypothetical protein
MSNNKRQTLETRIASMLAEYDSTTTFNVIAHELWGNRREGFETNTSWYLTKNADLAQVLDAARGRWEVFKINYLPDARVRDLEDDSCGAGISIHLSVNGTPFLEIRPNE